MNLHSRSNITSHPAGATDTIIPRGDSIPYHSPQSFSDSYHYKFESKNKALSQVSKASSMLRNLRKGLEYTNHQYSTLSEIDKLFALMSKEGCFSNASSTRSNTAQDIIFTDTLRYLTNKRFSILMP